jgi:5-formyltetrahydrofolate cyclo-ligase
MSAPAMSENPDWKTWRKAERERQIAARLALSAAEREAIAARVCAGLDALLDPAPGAIVSFYWTFKGELDLRGWIRTLLGRGIRSALPVVTEKARPMLFRLWTPETRMERGIWNILVPADGPSVTPDVIIAPLVGFDAECYRLGYGGGYFDRTLAGFPKQPLTIGVGYAASMLPSIRPQAHDIKMHHVVTEEASLGEGFAPASAQAGPRSAAASSLENS